jgi:hypothetical protein
VTVLDRLPSTSRSSILLSATEDGPPFAAGLDDPESEILRAVHRDPFAAISEIKREINRLPGRPIIGWWKIFSVLRRNRLLTRRARFYYARGRSSGPF